MGWRVGSSSHSWVMVTWLSSNTRVTVITNNTVLDDSRSVYTRTMVTAWQRTKENTFLTRIKSERPVQVYKVHTKRLFRYTSHDWRKTGRCLIIRKWRHGYIETYKQIWRPSVISHSNKSVRLPPCCQVCIFLRDNAQMVVILQLIFQKQRHSMALL